MLKIFFLTFIFIFLEFFAFEYVLDDISKYDIWKINFKASSQRRVFKIIQSIKTNNSDKVKMYVFGGSGSRELFLKDDLISLNLGVDFLNGSVSSESPYDSLKLMSAIKGPEQIVIYGIHPKSFLEYDKKYAIDGFYKGGYAYKYPIAYEWPFSKEHIKNLGFKDKLFINLNPYIDLVKLYFKNHSIYKKNFFKYDLPEPKQHYYGSRIMDLKKLSVRLKTFLTKVEKNKYKNMDFNFLILEKMIELAVVNKRRFVLFELPLSPIIKKELGNDLTYYYKKLNDLKLKYPKTIHLSQSLYKQIPQRYFFDSLHVNKEGRDAFSNRILISLSNLLNAKL